MVVHRHGLSLILPLQGWSTERGKEAAREAGSQGGAEDGRRGTGEQGAGPGGLGGRAGELRYKVGVAEGRQGNATGEAGQVGVDEETATGGEAR